MAAPSRETKDRKRPLDQGPAEACERVTRRKTAVPDADTSELFVQDSSVQDSAQNSPSRQAKAEQAALIAEFADRECSPPDTKPFRVDDNEDQDNSTDVGPNTRQIYDENNESYPAIPAFHPNVTKAKTKLQDLIYNVIDALDKDTKSARLREFREKATELLNIPTPEPLRVALAGEVGMGKSSLLNSLIGVPDLASTVSDSLQKTSPPRMLTFRPGVLCQQLYQCRQ